MKLGSLSVSGGSGVWGTDLDGFARYRVNQTQWLLNSRMARHLRAARIETRGVRHIAIVPVIVRAPLPVRQFADILAVDVPVPWGPEALSEGDTDAVGQILWQTLREGVARIDPSWGLPVGQLNDAIDRLRTEPYSATRTKGTVRVPSLGLRAALDHHMDAYRFSLTLRVTRGKDVVYETEILTSDPDPLYWHGLFRDVVLRDDAIVVRKRYAVPDATGVIDDVMFRLPLGDIPGAPA